MKETKSVGGGASVLTVLLAVFVTLKLTGLIAVFVTLKLTGLIAWSWWCVLSPLCAPIALGATIAVILAVKVCAKHR